MPSRSFRSRIVFVSAARVSCALVAVSSFTTTVHAAVIDANPSNYQNLLGSLAAGDTLRLAPGKYTQGLSLGGMAGTAAQPIVVKGPDDQSAIFTARDCCNTVQLEGSSYLQVMNLTLDGDSRDGAAGVDSRGSSHHITIENLKIIGHGGARTAGIATEGPAWNWIVRHNTITGAGTGLHLGNVDGSQPFVAGVIEYNLVVDTIGSNMEIESQLARPVGVGLPVGNSRTIIRHNVFSKRSATAQSEGAPPNVLLGHFPLNDAGAGDLYEIYGNFFYQNPAGALFEAEGNLAVHDNLFVNSSGDGVNIEPLDDKPRDVTVYHNTVVARGSGLVISGGDAAHVQSLVANASFAATPIAGPNQSGNVTGTYASAADSLNAPFAPIGMLDLFPRTGRLSGSAMSIAPGSAAGAKDFNGTTRSSAHSGAYDGEGKNSGWRLALAIKPSASSTDASATLAADPPQVARQGSSTLQWQVANATSCTASDGWSGSKQPSGSETVGPIMKDTTYSVTCTGPDTSVSKSVRVAVVSAAATPTLTMSASPNAIATGGTSIISWTTTGVDGCSASGSWMGTKGPNGSETVGPLQSTASYQLTCLGAGGNANAIVQVTVGGTAPPTTPPPTTPPPTTPPPTTPPPTTPPPTQPPTTPPPTTPPPTQPSPPPPADPAPPTSEMKSGGGSFDVTALFVLALIACARLRRRVPVTG